MSNLFSNIDELKFFVKVNSSIQLDTLAPYIDDARDMFISRYVGAKLMVSLETWAKDRAEDNAAMVALLPVVQRALAPFTLLVATHETSINFGDSGHTVSRTDKLAPASDAKIAKYTESLQRRAWNNLELALQFLDENAGNYPDFKANASHFIRSAADFQDNGLVDIDYSRLTYQSVVMTMAGIEQKDLLKLLGATLFDQLLKKIGVDAATEAEKAAISLIKKYIANQTAFIFSNTVSTNRRASAQYGVEYSPVFRPVYTNPDEGNYYENMAKYFMSELISTLETNATALAYTPVVRALQTNSEENPTFYMFG